MKSAARGYDKAEIDRRTLSGTDPGEKPPLVRSLSK